MDQPSFMSMSIIRKTGFLEAGRAVRGPDFGSAGVPGRMWLSQGRDRRPAPPSPKATHLMPSLGKAPSLRHLSAAVWRGRGGEEAQPELQAQRCPNTMVFSAPWPGAVAVTGLFLARRKGEHSTTHLSGSPRRACLPSQPLAHLLLLSLLGGTPAPTLALSQLS